MRWFKLLLASIIVLMAGSSEGLGEPQAGGWQRLALTGQDVQKLVVDPSDASHMDVLLGDGSHLASSDGGTTWSPSSDPRPLYARDPNDPRTYYRVQQNLEPQGRGLAIYRSDDDGATWRYSYGVTDTFPESSIPTVHTLQSPPPYPGIPSAVLASYYDVTYHFQDDYTRFSTDGGATWYFSPYCIAAYNPCWGTPPTGKVLAFAFDPARGLTYAPASRSRRLYFYTWYDVPPRLLRSSDWMSTTVQLPLPPGAELMPGIATDPDKPGRLYLLSSDVSNTVGTRNIWQTEDEGGMWFSIRTGLPDSLYFHAIVLQSRPPNPRRLILATSDGLWFREIRDYYFPLIQRGAR